MWTITVRDPTGKAHAELQLKGGTLTVGRGEKCDIVLPSPAVSRLHGRLRLAESGVPVYSDEKSSNGSMLDGREVAGAVKLGESSSLMIGGFVFSFANDGYGDAEKTLQLTPGRKVKLQSEELIPVQPAKPAAATPPQRPKPVMSFESPLEGARFTIPTGPEETMHPTPPAVPADKLSDSMSFLLDQQIRGIQSHRSGAQKSTLSAQEQFEQDWREAIAAARDLQARVKDNRKVLYYVISRDEQEISVKIADDARRNTNLILARRHPDTGKVQEGFLWIAVIGEGIYSYREPKEALAEFVRRIAARLA